MDLEDLAMWAKSAQPRTISDLKPLLVLCQGLLVDLIEGRLDVMRPDMEAIQEAAQAAMEAMQSDMDDLRRQLEAALKKLHEIDGGKLWADARAVLSLTTTVDTVVASEKIVAFSSKWAKDALRILHLPSLKVSPNWPTSKTPLHYVTALALNRDSSLLAIGNDRGKVLLYKLKNI